MNNQTLVRLLIGVVVAVALIWVLNNSKEAGDLGNDVSATVQDAGQSVKDLGHDVKDTVQDAVN